MNPSIIFAIGWTRLLSDEILRIPKHGCVGMHASLLPKYRGRAPVNWVIINNEKETGNSSILLDAGVDTGKIITQRKIPITMSDTCFTLYHKVSDSGRDMIKEIIEMLNNKRLTTIEQDESDATIMPKRTPEDGIIDWSRSSLEIFNWVRALTYPYPGAFTYLKDKKVFIWDVRIAHFPNLPIESFKEMLNFKPGTIIDKNDGIMVLTGDGELISIHKLSYSDNGPTDWKDFLTESQINIGDLFN